MGRILHFQKKKIAEFRGQVMKLLRNFAKLGLGAFVVAIATQFLPVDLSQEFPTLKEIIWSIPNWISAGLLWKLVELLIQMRVDGQFIAADLSRIRLSITTGNVINLLMRQMEKLTYIERRSDKHFPSMSKFWMCLQEDVLKVVWNNHDAGYSRLEKLIKEFVYLKIIKANIRGHAVLSVIMTDFQNDILAQFQNALSLPNDAPRQRAFLTACITTEIPRIFTDNQNFAWDFSTQHFEQ